MFKSRTFVEMSEECLSYVLQSDKLKADESEVLNAVKEWSTVNAVRIRKKTLSLFFKFFQSRSQQKMFTLT